nr:family 20 glycosylhydrolase [bacterium]
MFATRPKGYMLTGDKRALANNVSITGAPEALEGILRSCLCGQSSADGYTHIRFESGIPDEVQQRAAKAAQRPFEDRENGFVIEATGDQIVLYTHSQDGMFSAAMTLAHRASEGKLENCLIWDYPLVGVRGVKVYIPDRADIPYFKKLIDMMVYFRMNTLMWEIGGAMEYKRHPEVNEGWEEYCAKTKAYPGGTEAIQDFLYPWRKNSIHNENGGGSYLTQDEIKELITYIRARNIEIIPECPSTSHCDYMLTRHRDLAEHPEDEYADTFCTSNPDSYKLLFDLLDEVIEVFQPRIINIGHDEYYSFGTCPRCRHRDPVDIFTQDVLKIYNFLKSRGVRTMFWSDKIMNVTNRTGHGGANNLSYKAWNPQDEYFGMIPATWPAIYRLPKDILCLNWYWGNGAKFDKPYRDNGYQVIFGNFDGSYMRGWRARLKDNILGGIVSNWSSPNEIYMQRNCVLFEIAYDNQLYWDEKADSNRMEELCQNAFEALFTWKYRGVSRTPSGNGKGRYIRFLHNSSAEIPYQLHFDGVYIDWAKYKVGQYVLTYEDGTKAHLDILSGLNIGYRDEIWYTVKPEDADDISVNRRLCECANTTMPQRFGGETYYEWLAENPHPEKAIIDIACVPVDKLGDIKPEIHVQSATILA